MLSSWSRRGTSWCETWKCVMRKKRQSQSDQTWWFRLELQGIDVDDNAEITNTCGGSLEYMAPEVSRVHAPENVHQAKLIYCKICNFLNFVLKRQFYFDPQLFTIDWMHWYDILLEKLAFLILTWITEPRSRGVTFECLIKTNRKIKLGRAKNRFCTALFCQTTVQCNWMSIRLEYSTMIFILAQVL